MKNLPRMPIIIGVVLIVGIVIGYFVSNFSFGPNLSVEQKVKNFYELALPGTTAEVVNLKEESGVYKALIKMTNPNGINYQEVYVTKDGKLLSPADSTILVEGSIEQIGKSKNFVDCLYDKGVRIYGLSNQSTQGGVATTLQLNLLGIIYSPKLFVSCDDQFAQQCINIGVSQVPSVVIGKNIDAGMKTMDWFVNKTGCKL